MMTSIKLREFLGTRVDCRGSGNERTKWCFKNFFSSFEELDALSREVECVLVVDSP